MKKIYKALALFIAGFAFISCDSMLDLKPLSSPTDETFFSDETELQLALNSVYGSMPLFEIEHMPFQMYMEAVLSDNSFYRITDEQAGLQALSKSEQTSTSGFEKFYENLYKGIGRANNLLQNMDKASGVVNETQFNDIKAQALCMRAYFYHRLVLYFGDVPYLDFVPTTPDQAFLPRTPKEEILDTILADLDNAASLMDKGITGVQDRITLPFVYAIKARIALYAGRFDVAATAAQMSLEQAEANGYQLHPSYGELFTFDGEDSPEILMRLPYNEEGFGKSHRIVLRFGTRFGTYSQCGPAQNLIDAYLTKNGLPIDEDPEYDPTNPWENRDPRLKATVVLPQDLWAGRIYESHPDSLESYKIENGVKSRELNRNCRSVHWPAYLSGYLYRKYVDETSLAERTTKTDVDLHFMRLAEVYLILAEAEIERNGGDLNKAASAINKLRERAWSGEDDYPAVTATSKEQMRKVLRMERRVELAMEGFRYDDLLRWRMLEKVRTIPFVGRVLDLKNAKTVPSIDMDGIVTYPDMSEYDKWQYMRNEDGSVKEEGYTPTYKERWHNAWNRKFNPDRDYLFPIPQSEIDLYEANGKTLPQNKGY
ncbi:starch-binding protein (plasmid) [Fulvitalea axinellae]|uniref:Starch-binding protein n=1 Tax=Fulvitalea axinellae TaxID=1182444 RepID=A0AAU9CRU5_9BACT|nr:starch-binding protein [Fulvitalea axinellae]